MKQKSIRLSGTGLMLLTWCLAATALADEPPQIVTEICGGCHGVDGNSIVPTFPSLAGQQPEYTTKQLKEFVSRKRLNVAMEPFLPQLKTADLDEIASYFSAQKPASREVADAALAEAGRTIFERGKPDAGVPACGACHMPTGEGFTRFPRLAGQDQEYIKKQIADFRSGTRNNDRGRVMRAIAERMSDQDTEAVATFISGL